MEDNKLSLKRVELSLSKFNEVAIPHHLDLLRQHRVNILKYEEAGEYARVRTEQLHARRVAAQLRGLLGELDALRRHVRPEDAARFDALTRRARDRTLAAILDYQDGPAAAVGGSVASTQSVGGSVASTESVGVLPQAQLELDHQELEMNARMDALRGWDELKEELSELHQAWAALQLAAQAQAEQVSAAAGHVEAAQHHVRLARSSLSLAERLRVGAWGAGGAVVGAAVAGPPGLLLGGKLALLAALAGSLAGYFCGRSVDVRRQAELVEEEQTLMQKSKDD